MVVVVIMVQQQQQQQWKENPPIEDGPAIIIIPPDANRLYPVAMTNQYWVSRRAKTSSLRMPSMPSFGLRHPNARKIQTL